MNTAAFLLNGVKARLNCSDYEIARRLDIARSLVSEWRNGKRPIPDHFVVALAELAEIPAPAALARAHLAQASPATRPTWERIYKAVGPVMLAGMLTLPVWNDKTDTSSVYYVKSRKRAA